MTYPRRRAFVALSALSLTQAGIGEATARERYGPAATRSPSGGTRGATASPPAGSPSFESPAVTDDGLPVFAERLKDELDFPLAWGTSPIRDVDAWRRAAREKVEEHLFQPPDDTPFAAEVTDERQAGGVRPRIVHFDVTRFSRVRAVLLLPAGEGPFPAVLLLHDHGSKFDIGKEKLVRPWYDEAKLSSAEEWAGTYFGGRFVGDELARRGYAVLAVDALGWGDRSGLEYADQQALASNLFHLGASPAGLLAREDQRAAAFLAGLPEVDGERVAALGFSMGAYRAWQVAALSEHVGAAVSACWMTGLRELMVPGNNTLRGQSAYFMLHPGLPRHLDFPDVASIAAPKPVLFMHGEQDALFPAAGVATAYRKMRAVWHARHADERLCTQLWPDLGHVFVPEMQDEAFRWLDRWAAVVSGS